MKNAQSVKPVVLNAEDTEYLLTSVHQLLTSFLRLGNLVLQQAGAQKSELPRIPPPIQMAASATVH